ncbi:MULTISPECIES: alpha/beta hydrolase family esterase [unclassified Leisingera]|uniref:alpha/beta hydrolase family esterase n=1 Tax=unclassified Leisingera TaxID=2614906 RepID=UPI0002F231ED|nr:MULTISPECIES: polyhydroxybutyrate depolymerase [unclassified Leisingera]KIC14996.1 polyhydroxybutyrate depolymerase [Leisingera sp. ANG-DT]KIC23464.1 polyhydroxybutyrate depolymerase [Leisingera sp. ANG-S3]KIC30920.1 polyhydroxybutyrate depolymerase [Leisingera sp. ANG-M6]KIC33992.1 polyhydroxybutyrate depolymerase [Leisingera sp. ANG-S5]KIC54945.1 polyhydroxybutyrate depolymerase [Leisingera sp. ANG-S]
MLSRIWMLLIAGLLAAPTGAAEEAAPCGGETPCPIDGGDYHLALPEGWQGGPAVMFLHGYGSSGAKVIANTGLVGAFSRRGYAVIAPSGLPWAEGKPADWSVRDGWNTYPRRDLVFLRDVLADATERAGVEPDQLLLSGFSRGGSMVWDAACQMPEFAAAYVPVSGGFWLPMVRDCKGPVKLLHIHGFTDKVVPLEGRVIQGSVAEIIQADIWEGLQLWRRENSCRRNAADHQIEDGIWRKRWDCEAGGLELILHKGGHGLPKGWSTMALDWFESLER